MRTGAGWVVAVALTGCTTEAEVVADMEDALGVAQVAVVAQLLVTELLAHTFDEPTPTEPTTTLRHDEDCGCPCIERIGEAPPFVLTVDYPGTGCVPLTGLVPSTMAGHAVLEYDGEAVRLAFDDLTIGRDHAVAGTIEGDPAVDGIRFAATGTVAVGDHAVHVNTTTDYREDDGLVFDGDISVDDTTLTLEGVDLPWGAIPPPCPSPVAGVATRLGNPDVWIDFGTPGGGDVTVGRKNRLSEAVDYCAYRTDLF